MRSLLNSLAVPSWNEGYLTLPGLLMVGAGVVSAPVEVEPWNEPGGYHSPVKGCCVMNGCKDACCGVIYPI